MKRGTVILAAVMFVGLLSAAAYGIHKTIPAESEVPLPGPYGDSLYSYITGEDSYDQWSLWPGKGRRFKARAPLNIVTTYVNENAFYSISLGKPMVNGSIVVTENYDKSGKLGAIFVMYKIKGYNPSAGDWFWAQYSPKGKTVKAGKVQACIDCHKAKAGNDYLFTSDFVK